MPKIGKVRRVNDKASPIMLHEKSMIEHNARTLDAATRAYLQADTRLANDNTPNVVVWNNRESIITIDKDQ